MAHAGTMSGRGYVAQRAAVLDFLTAQPPTEEWTTGEIAGHVGLSTSRAGDILRELHGADLIVRTKIGNGYLYRAGGA